MKIRTDFVTNSSSSSFVAVIYITDKDKKTYAFYPEQFVDADCDDGFDIRFRGSLEQAREKTGIDELCNYLVDSLDFGFDMYYVSDEDIERLDAEDEEAEDCGSDLDCDDDGDADDDDYEAEMREGVLRNLRSIKKSKKEFAARVAENIKSVGDIRTILVTHNYYAWGEFADLIADNDDTLCELAEQYHAAKGLKKRRLRKKLIKYIETSNADRAGESFGDGYEDIRYLFDPTDENLDNLAERLVSCYGPGNVEGTTYDSIDMKTGKITRYAEFDLE